MLIWLVRDDPKMRESVFEQIRLASHRNQVWVSAITPWEIGLLAAKRKIDLEMDVQTWVDKALSLPGIRLQLLSPAIAVSSTRLPWEMYPDSAHRILVATARHIGATLVTADQQLLRYGADKHFRCLSAL